MNLIIYKDLSVLYSNSSRYSIIPHDNFPYGPLSASSQAPQGIAKQHKRCVNLFTFAWFGWVQFSMGASAKCHLGLLPRQGPQSTHSPQSEETEKKYPRNMFQVAGGRAVCIDVSWSRNEKSFRPSERAKACGKIRTVEQVWSADEKGGGCRQCGEEWWRLFYICSSGAENKSGMARTMGGKI